MEGAAGVDQNDRCPICEDSLSEGVTVNVQKGLPTLIEASKKRGDEKWELWTNAECVLLHVACRKSYTRDKSIQAVIKTENQKAEKEKGTTASPISQKLRSKDSKFDFKENCIFCFEVCSHEKEKKKGVSRREKICEVMTLKFRQSIVDKADERKDEWGKKVKALVVGVQCLVAEEAKYHDLCSSKFFSKQNQQLNPKGKRGRPEDVGLSAAFERVFSFMEESEDCQFNLQELLDLMTDYHPDARFFKRKLEEKYGADVIITNIQKKASVVCFRKTGHKILSDSWYNERHQNEDEERQRIIRTAAAMIKEDIKSKVYDTSNYPTPHKLSKDAENSIPASLQVFLHELIEEGAKGQEENRHRKSTAIAHSVISSIRPRSFISPILLGVAVYVHRKFGSKLLLHILSNLGFSASYNEAQLFEASCMKSNPTDILDDSFMQFVFDNADFDVNTIDGHQTFHSMGGIQCVTPAESMVKPDIIERLKEMPSAEDISRCSNIPVRIFMTHSESGLKSIEIEDLKKYKSLPDEALLMSPSQLIWMSGKWLQFKDIPSWNGFMEVLTKNEDFETTSLRFLPFLNMKATSSDAINSVLYFSSETCKRQNQSVTCVTFDQPLYAKAREIVSSPENTLNLSNIIVRLGGFHLLMSYLGSVGYIMAGSGLKELWATAYAPKSIEKMLTGHSFSRAVRAHQMTHLALGELLLDDMILSSEQRAEITHILQQYEAGELSMASLTQSRIIIDSVRMFNEHLQEKAMKGNTAKLWAQYFEMITLLLHYIEAERLGNWELHLMCVQKFIPYLHAAGHIAYAKSCHLYLQDMHNLQQRMTEGEFEKFAKQGFFTMRRSNKKWAGLWADMTVEQTLMRTMKTSGGLTHGRGITDSVLSRWILGMPASCEICIAVEEYCGLRSSYSEQHVELRPSRIARDNEDTRKFLQWFKSHPPFSENSHIMSIATGMKGDSKVNCHRSYDVGLQSMNTMTGQNFHDVTLKRSARVVPLAAVNLGVKVRDNVIPIDTTLLFQRIMHTMASTEDLQVYFGYELAPVPPALFTEQGMRKSKKSALYNLFNKVTEQTHDLQDAIFVVDGGFLLHRVTWPSLTCELTYNELYDSYISYVKQCYGDNTIVVFDGYGESEMSTKNVERQRRSAILQSNDILFNCETSVAVGQEKFLANAHNKSRFIFQLATRLCDSGFSVTHALDDADYLIVQTAIQQSLSGSKIVVVGEDVDLLVLITALTPTQRNIIFLKPGRGRVPTRQYSSINLQAYLSSVKDYVLFLHAASGCDTVSSLFRQGKLKFFNLLQKREDLKKFAAVFNDKSAPENAVADAGERFLLALYGAAKEETSLNSFRLTCFRKATVRNIRQVKLESLPPSVAASRQHFLRVYHQVQLWQSNTLPAEQWGWKLEENGLTPVTTDLPPAPDHLLHLISCSCTKNCGRRCGCVKAGLRCSIVCTTCRGGSCSNSPLIEGEELTDADDEYASDDHFELDDIDEGPDVSLPAIHNDNSTDEESDEMNCMASTSAAPAHPMRTAKKLRFSGRDSGNIVD